jgi:hypothetical protein
MLFKPNPTSLTSAYARRHLKQVTCSPTCIRARSYMHTGSNSDTGRIPCKQRAALSSYHGLETRPEHAWSLHVSLISKSSEQYTDLTVPEQEGIGWMVSGNSFYGHTHTHTHSLAMAHPMWSNFSSNLEVNSIHLWDSAIPLVLDSKRTSRLVVFKSTNDGSRGTATCNGSSWCRPSALGTSNMEPIFMESAVCAPNLTISAHSILVASRPGSLLLNIGYVPLLAGLEPSITRPNKSCVHGSISKHTE